MGITVLLSQTHGFEVRFVGRNPDDENVFSAERRHGFDSACAAAAARGRIQLLDNSFCGGKVEERIACYCRQLLSSFPVSDLPTGVVCWNDEFALALCMAARRLGIRVPEDLSVVGFDDMLASSSDPPLTSVSHMYSAIGELAVEMLLEKLELAGTDRAAVRKRENDDPEVRMVEPELIIRKSTAPPGEKEGGKPLSRLSEINV